MEIRCSECGHVGAAEATTDENGIALICAECGHKNRLDMGKPEPAPELSEQEPAINYAALAQLPAAAKLKEKEDEEEFRRAALERLIPEPGPGPRCPKCAHVVVAHDVYCSRCGLAIDEAMKHAPGEAPWERPPAGREGAHEQVQLLWSALEDDWTQDNFERFAQFVRDEGLVDFATRKLRFRLVDHPDDELALEFLGEIAESLQSRLAVAKAQAKASAEQFSEVTQRTKSVLLYATFIIWMFIVAVVATMVKC